MKKEKKLIAPNELPFGRWLAVLAATLGLYLVVFIVAVIVFPDLPKYLGAPGLEKETASIFGLDVGTMLLFLSFIPAFVGFVLFLKVIGKTTLKEFILGVGGRLNKKSCLIVAGLFVLGFAINVLMNISYIKLGNVEIGNYLFLIFFALVSVIFQISLKNFCAADFSRVGYAKISSATRKELLSPL